MSAHRKYDPEMFRRLREHGATARGIAWIYGMSTPMTVYAVLPDGNWSPRLWKKNRDAETIAVWRAGVERGETNEQIAEKAGVSLAGLRHVLRRWGLRKPAKLPIFGRKCRSCLKPLSTNKHERDAARCIACGRRHCRNGSCECGFARRLKAATCERCGKANP